MICSWLRRRNLKVTTCVKIKSSSSVEIISRTSHLQNFEIGKPMESTYWNVRYIIVGQITETFTKSEVLIKLLYCARTRS